jgi:hypothetical protein
VNPEGKRSSIDKTLLHIFMESWREKAKQPHSKSFIIPRNPDWDIEPVWLIREIHLERTNRKTLRRERRKGR